MKFEKMPALELGDIIIFEKSDNKRYTYFYITIEVTDIAYIWKRSGAQEGIEKISLRNYQDLINIVNSTAWKFSHYRRKENRK